MSKNALKKSLLGNIEGIKKALEEFGSDNVDDGEEDGLDSPRVERRSAPSSHASNSHLLQFTPSSALYAEQQRLFGPRRTSSGRKGKGKKRRHDGTIVHRTWTRKFVCLRNRSDFAAPKRAEKAILMRMNLGERRLTFGVNSTATDVDKYLPKRSLSNLSACWWLHPLSHRRPAWEPESYSTEDALRCRITKIAESKSKHLYTASSGEHS